MRRRCRAIARTGIVRVVAMDGKGGRRRMSAARPAVPLR
ncbi:hypothetical protein NH44784_038851 [Achromobacter xylosoxidans NH44784-1996]|nr:hypothetical protein NH44784_038851 [Achromobacter xylosoxidans NH44784-1996]